MIMIGYCLIVVVLLACVVFILKKKEVIKQRASAVKIEMKDVVDAVVEVGNQIGDILKAMKGRKRTGRK